MNKVGASWPGKAGNSYVGSPVERIEDDRLLRGRGTFVADVVAQNALSAVLFRSPVAHALIRRIDVEAARKLPGVVAVLTHEDIGADIPMIPLRQQVLPEGVPYLQPVIASDRVRYVGEPIAVVVADDPAIAEDALELIDLDYEDLTPVVTTEAAASDEIILFGETRTNLAYTMQARQGDTGKAFDTAHYTRRESFSVQRHMASPMETRGLLADWNAAAGTLSVYGAAKVAFFNRNLLAEFFGLSRDDVDYIEVDVGGGFGARGEFYPEDYLIPFASRHVSRPVRWIEDRREHFLATNHAREMDAEIEIACDADGTIVGLRGVINVDIGAYVRTNGFTAPRNVAQFCAGPYDVANIELDARVLVTNKTPAGTYRGPGRFEGTFFFERLIDMAARDLGIDPAAIRRRNLIAEEKMPYKLARMAHADPSSETQCDGGAYAEVFDRCIAEFDWAGKQKFQGKLIDGRYHGLGLGCFIEGGAAGPREGARIVLETDGTVSVYAGSSALGQGLETVLCQIAADALGLPMDRISIFHGSTNLVKEGFGSFHSRSTVMGGSAVLEGCGLLLQSIREHAAAKVGCSAEEVIVRDGVLTVRGETIALAGLSDAPIVVEHSFSNSKHTYSYGTHAAHVAVDPETGDVEILDYCTVEDVGRVINPATLHGQVLGSAVQGFGSAFLEELVYDESGQLLTGTFADYLLPTATDFPAPRSVSLGLRPCPNNPLGAKGAGEGGLIAVGGALGNAIAAALRSYSVEPCHLPFSPGRIWRLIHSPDPR
ncbi:xanthine dehydrogenase family protein molybdopterin-binding subunit [Mesorhizobium sp. A556]